jgi:hypothetical protein
MLKSIRFVLFILGLSLCGPAWSKTLTETELLAGTMTAEQIGDFLGGLERKPTNLAIFQIKLSNGMDPSLGEYLEGEINRVLRDSQSISMIQCNECRTPQIEVREDKLVVKRGSPDNETLAKIGKQLGVDSFLAVDVFRTKFSITTNVNLVQASDGSVLYSKQVKVPALDWSDDGLQIIIAGGPAQTSGGLSADSTQNKFSTAGHFFLFEEVGFGKAGFGVSSISGPTGNLVTLTPAVAWRSRFGTTGIYSLKTLGVGFGTSDGLGGVAFRADYSLMLGSFTTLGINFTQFSPIGPKEDHKPISSSVNLYVGFSLGR